MRSLFLCLGILATISSARAVDGRFEEDCQTGTLLNPFKLGVSVVEKRLIVTQINEDGSKSTVASANAGAGIRPDTYKEDEAHTNALVAAARHRGLFVRVRSGKHLVESKCPLTPSYLDLQKELESCRKPAAAPTTTGH